MTELTLGRARGSGSRSARRTRLVGQVVLYAIATAMAILFMIPFAWTVFSSLKSAGELYQYPPAFVPKTFHFENYRTIFQLVPYGQWMWNSVFVAGLSTIGAVVSSALVGFSFARFRYPGRDVIFLLTLSTMMLPTEVTLIPLYIMFAKIHWLDSFKPLIIPSFFGGGAFLIFLMRQFFMTIPLDLDEAALIDGAGYLRIFSQIVLPLCIPALTTGAVLSFLGNWGDFMFPFIFLNSKIKLTLAVGVRYFQGQADVAAVPTDHLLMGAGLMMTAPVIVIFFLTQGVFVRGIVMTGIKG